MEPSHRRGWGPNPVVAKELIQAAHHRRTYALRAGVAAVAVVILGTQVMDLLQRYGQDWRALAMVARPLFGTLAWLQFVTFSLLAFVASAAAIHQEWTNRTVEVLLATPLSRARIVYGKFVAVLSEVLMVALALLPITGVLYGLGRMPREVALGSFAVTVGSVLFFGSMGLLAAAALRPRGGRSAGVLSIIVPLLLLLVLLDAYVWVRHPVLEALIPPRAFYLVLQGRAPSGWTPGEFAGLSFGLMAGLSAVSLLLTPRAFEAAFARAQQGENRSGLWARLRRRLRGRRPPMRPRDNPLLWQEKGPPTRMLRWTLWVVYGITMLLVLGYALHFDDFTFFGDEGFYLSLTVEGLMVVVGVSGLYGLGVFAREKSLRTAQALLLTGHSPARFFWAKVRALYRGLGFSVVVVGALGLAWLVVLTRSRFAWHGHDVEETTAAVLAMLEILLLGPAAAAVVGMVFSSAASTPRRATVAVGAGVLIAITLGFLLSTTYTLLFDWHWDVNDWLLPVLVVTASLVAVNRTWTPWRLSVLLGLSIILGLSAMFAVADYVNSARGYGEDLLFLAGVSAVIGSLVVGWLVLGLRTFERGFAGELARTKRRP